LKELSYELVKTVDELVPIRINRVQANSSYSGCVFHWHEQLEFYYVISGGVFMLCNGKQDWILPGEIGFVNWCEPHRGAHFKEQTEHYVIQIDLSKVINNSKLLSEKSYFSPAYNYLSNVPTYIKSDPTLYGYLKKIIDEIYTKKIGYEFIINGTIQYLLSHLLRTYCQDVTSSHNIVQNSTSLDLVQKLLKYITNNYTEKISLDNLAKHSGLSTSYMCRLFKKHVGLTILDYINELRCERAASLIANGVPLSEAYYLVGFNDYNYFSRLFKNVTGSSPANYKKGLQKNLPA
jgi:YesN/AraC family two-component response regulator